MIRAVKWCFAIAAYLTIAHNAVILIAVIDQELDTSPGTTGMYGLEFDSMASPDAKLLLFHAGWTTVLALGCLLRTRRKSIEETRCRKCQYILRGLTEPKCPECGEAI